MQIIPSIPTWEAHPIDRLYRAGVSLNVNTDGRMCTPTNMNHEYEGMSQVFGWTNDQFLATNLMAVEAAFVEEDVKQRLRTTLIATYS